ncbi:MAG: hypothetical protein ITG02_01230 [Patulibacter sp.]|nr:hypothetical protein [Patulibacter sp.]
MATTVLGGDRPLTLLDDTAVTARHIVRAAESDPGAVEVLPGQWWAPAPGNALEGEQGWVSASVERRLSDHGLLSSLTLPNAPGPDGIEHRERFAVRSGPRYKAGHEWVELTDRASQRALAVESPTTARVDGSTVNVSGVDAGALPSGWREGKLAMWTASAPQDVVDHYSQAPMAVVADSFLQSQTSGWTLNGAPTHPTASSLGLAFAPTSSGSNAASKPVTTPTEPGGSWSAKFEVVPHALPPAGYMQFGCGTPAGTVFCALSYASGAWSVSLWSGPSSRKANVPALTAGETTAIEIIASNGWISLVVDGAVALQVRRAGDDRPTSLVALATNGVNVTLRRAELRALVPFLRRAAAAIDYRLPGAPPPGGLTGDYYLETDTWAKAAGDYASFWATALAPASEPYATRVDPQLQFGADGWMPPGPPGWRQFSVRWHGAVYLPLAERDVWCGLYGVAGLNIVGMARMWIGSTRAGSPYLDKAWSGEQQAPGSGGSLRSHLGSSKSGWYPIVIEYAAGATGDAPRIALTSSTGASATPQVTIPSAQLSPYGCWSGDVAGESHREIIDAVATASGLQWRVQPCTLESGEFPGRLEFGRPLGQQTDYVLEEHAATEYMAEVDAGETCNHIHGDGAGLGKADGSDRGLTVDILDPDATDDPWLTTRYEQLQDITELSLMQQRLDALLALYSTPHEQVAARPKSSSDEQVYEWGDAFPAVGSVRQMHWEPGDGIRLHLPSVGVNDLTPRQIATVQQTLRPAGRVPPVLGFRQRPRHLRERLRTLTRQATVGRRSYQGQLAMITGSSGSTSTTIAPDGYSRLGLPSRGIVRVELRIVGMSGSAQIEVLGVATGITATRPGTYDVTAWVPPGAAEAYARLTSPTGVYNIQLVATLAI